MVTTFKSVFRTFQLVTKYEKQILQQLGRRIAFYRKARGISQEELGYGCEMEKSHISRLEREGTNPTVLTLQRICAELQVTLKDLFE